MTAAASSSTACKASAPAARRRIQKRKAQAYCGVLLASVARKRLGAAERKSEPSNGREMREEVLKMQASVDKMEQQVQAAARAIEALQAMVAQLADQRHECSE